MIHFDKVTFWYRKNEPLFKEVDLELEPGRIYGLLGKNGAGKTTLLKLACGLVFPKSGTVSVDGTYSGSRRVSTLSDIYFMPEEISTPVENPRQLEKMLSPFYPRFNSGKFGELLEKLEVEYHQPLRKQSFGQRKKAMIAFAIACNTSYLFLDEPTNGLDIPSKAAFRRIIASETDPTRTIIVSTHQVKDVDSLVDGILILHNRHIILHDTLENISSKFRFLHGNSVPAGALFTGEGVMGKSYILPNLGDDETSIDLELLFNAWVSEPEKFSNMLFLNSVKS
ncbi:MAG TPA: ABC transporter ATP-binding protein [Bacteroidales bacterium]|nr:ABC transporter ATP-binding protein [Bacteroidales bacterium]